MNNDRIDMKNLNTSDPKIFKEVFDKFSKKYIHLASKKTGDPEEARDMVSDIFTNLWKAEIEFENEKALESYLYTCVLNAVINASEKVNVRKTAHRKLAQTPQEEVTSADTGLIRADIIAGLASRVEELSPRRRQIIQLRYFEFLSPQEVAIRMNISESTVYNSEKAAIRSLRGKISKKRWFSVYIISLLSV